MKMLSAIFVILISLQAWSHSDKKSKSGKAHHHHNHREHGAHQHGVGTVGLAFEANKGKLEFKIPAESIIGFEHEAKKESDIKKQTEALAKFESKINEMIVFDSTLKCTLTKEKVEIVREQEVKEDKSHKHKHTHGAHSDFEARYDVGCEKSPAGTDLTIKIHSQFKKIKKIELQIILDNLQKAQTVTKDGVVVSLK